jgi:hypothetical protein
VANLALVFDIIGKDHASATFDKVGKSAESNSKKTSALSSGLKNFAAGFATAFAADKVVGFFSDSVKAASAAEQAVGGVQAVFKDYAKQIETSASKADTALGLSKTAYMELTTVLASGLKNKGIKDYAAQSENLVKIGADLSAQFGGSTKEAVDALGSAMRGEMDPIERYGVSMNQAAIEAEAMRMGLVKTSVDTAKVAAAQLKAEVATTKYREALKKFGGDSNEAKTAQAAMITAQAGLSKAMKGSKVQLDDQQKAMAALSLITRQTSDASGAFGRESDTLAGKQERAKAQWENLQQTIGEKFLPVIASATGFVSDNISTLAALAGILGVVGAVVLATSLATKTWTAMQAVAKAATVAWTGAQWLMNAALTANPIGIVIALVAALAAGLVIAYQKSDTFRTIVQAAWKGVQDGATFMWEKVLKPTFRFLVLSWLTVAGAILSGAKTAFGWVPGLGPKLQEASDKFDQFKTDVNKALGGIDDEPVTVSVGFKYGGPTTSKYKKPLYYMGDGYGLDSYGKGIGDGPGLDVKSVFPSMSSISTNSRNAAMAGGLDQLMSMYEDSGSSGAPAGAMKWQALWAAVRAAVPGATLNSSFRKNAITATGNRSYHSMGRAIDIGPATMATFRKVKALFPRATELIFSPAGREQLWHGVSHMFSGITRANHWDHIHLAMQQGGLVPGTGRGDKVPALLEPGEYVVSRPQVQRQGVASLDAMNAGKSAPEVKYIFQGDVYDVGLLDRMRREQVAEQRAANFRAGVTA